MVSQIVSQHKICCHSISYLSVTAIWDHRNFAEVTSDNKVWCWVSVADIFVVARKSALQLFSVIRASSWQLWQRNLSHMEIQHEKNIQFYFFQYSKEKQKSYFSWDGSSGLAHKRRYKICKHQNKKKIPIKHVQESKKLPTGKSFKNQLNPQNLGSSIRIALIVLIFRLCFFLKF